MSTMFILHLVLILTLAVILLTVVGNMLYLRRTSRRSDSSFILSHEVPSSLVSVLIPARNEAARIGACLASFAGQTYRSLEVLVLDDCSEDGTAEIARSFEGRVPGLRVVSGVPLAAHWIGKPHACAQLAARARGEWLLFTDADVVHGPDSVARGVAAAEATRADLLTALPRQRTDTFAEKLAIPLLYFAVAGFLPMFLMGRSRSERMAAASGQYMLFRREAYDAVGGHEAVRRNVVDDVGLARAVRRAGRRLVIANGVGFVSCRMYTSGADVAEGFSKNFFAGLGNSTVGLVALIVAALALFVLPPVGLALAPALGFAWEPFATEVCLALAARVILARTFAQPLWVTLLHPVAVLAALGVALRSFWLTRFGGGVVWKGRRISTR
jgi:chlorobactene glucosyltransferase